MRKALTSAQNRLKNRALQRSGVRSIAWLDESTLNLIAQAFQLCLQILEAKGPKHYEVRIGRFPMLNAQSGG
jgi:hypothetical protein